MIIIYGRSLLKVTHVNRLALKLILITIDPKTYITKQIIHVNLFHNNLKLRFKTIQSDFFWTTFIEIVSFNILKQKNGKFYVEKSRFFLQFNWIIFRSNNERSKGWDANSPNDNKMWIKKKRECCVWICVYVNSFYQVLLPKLSSDCSIYSYTFWFVYSAVCVPLCVMYICTV